MTAVYLMYLYHQQLMLCLGQNFCMMKVLDQFHYYLQDPASGSCDPEVSFQSPVHGRQHHHRKWQLQDPAASITLESQIYI